MPDNLPKLSLYCSVLCNSRAGWLRYYIRHRSVKKLKYASTTMQPKMEIKTCLICGKKYIRGGDSERVFYSLSNSLCSNNVCRKQGRPKYFGYKSVCSVCGNEYVKLNATHNICSYKCRLEYAKKPRTVYTKRCESCGRNFQTQRDCTKYCSDKCARKSRWQRDKLLGRDKRYYNQRIREPRYKLDKRMGSSIWHSLKNNKNGVSWVKLVGYSVDDLMHHLEQQFVDGMTWDNYGEWHIDHIIPKSLFQYRTPKDKGFQRCWCLSNLRPLWANENIRKSNKLFI